MLQPPDLTAFNQLVWSIVMQIPEGQVSTYGQIASAIPPPEGVEPPAYDQVAARWVGYAMRDTPDDSGVPWHRVINSRGAISLPAGSASADEQRMRLEAEGVAFDDAGRVDFEAVGWDGPEPAWLEAHGLLAPKPLRRGGPTSSQLSLL